MQRRIKYLPSIVIAFVVAVAFCAPTLSLAESEDLWLAGASATVTPTSNWPDYSCIRCHMNVTPGIVTQYLSGAMGMPGVQNPDVASRLGGMDRAPCTACHGSDHTDFDDWREARLPDHNTCRACHYEQVEQFLAGKHALAWKAMKAMPMTQKMPKEELLFGCGGCHKIGVKEPQELLDLGLPRPYGIGATCDQCHTRHAFSAYEARKPEACAKCHMGFDHPQWEMWSTSKHGNIYFIHRDEYPFNVSLKYVKPSDYPGPTCQLCHMPKGNHTVLTPWGFIALVGFAGRPSGLEIVNDPEWEQAKAEVLKALRVLDPEGNPTQILDAVLELRVVRISPEEFMHERMKLLNVCSGCHSKDFALNYLKAADEVIRHTTLQLAEAILAVKEAREAGVLPPRPNEPDNPYPFLLNFYEEPSGVEREVWLLFLEYRMRAFQGMFHVNPDYTHWYGWSQVRRAVEDVKEDVALAARLSNIEQAVAHVKEQAKGVPETRATTVTVTTTIVKPTVTERTFATTVTTVVERVSTRAFMAAVGVAAAVAVIAVYAVYVLLLRPRMKS
ncbi:MAG: multiheme c-type cytochrome [Thermoproteota archaeon]